jgi:nitrate reductase gamma subunit
MRKHPVMTMVTFVFHLCLFAAPLFFSAHVILFKESWDVSWAWLPDGAADLMTLAVMGACLFFLGRRIFLREVRYLTSLSDFVILACVALPFISGYWACHQWAGFQAATMVHMVSGEILIMMIPFTRLSHMFFFPVIRGYMGSEFGAVRRARDW